MTIDDVQRALERAAESVARWDGTYHDEDMTPEVMAEYMLGARAAVLAFLKAMPAMTRHKLSTGDGGHAYSPDGWNLHTLAAAIEEA